MKSWSICERISLYMLCLLNSMFLASCWVLCLLEKKILVNCFDLVFYLLIHLRTNLWVPWVHMNSSTESQIIQNTDYRLNISPNFSERFGPVFIGKLAPDQYFHHRIRPHWFKNSQIRDNNKSNEWYIIICRNILLNFQIFCIYLYLVYLKTMVSSMAPRHWTTLFVIRTSTWITNINLATTTPNRKEERPPPAIFFFFNFTTQNETFSPILCNFLLILSPLF